MRNVTIWGNHSSTQYPDVRHALVRKGAEEVKVTEALPDTAWLQDQFITVSGVTLADFKSFVVLIYGHYVE